VARHSRATGVSVDIIVQDYSVVVRVVDNGLGLPADIDINPGNGLRNLRTRAEVHGGSCVIESPNGAGTRIEWSVPLL
jgi:signal transduction histidine kinase